MVNIFSFDIFGYDSYLPEEKDLNEISYFINIGEYGSNYHLLDEEGVPVAISGNNPAAYDGQAIVLSSEHGSGFILQETLSSAIRPVEENGLNYIYREKYQMNVSKTTETRPILDLIGAHMNGANDSSKTSQGRDIQMLVCYGLKNGRSVYRNYVMDRSVVEEYYKIVYDTDYGKNVIYPYGNLSGEEAELVRIQTPFMRETDLELTREEIKELAGAYKQNGDISLIDKIETLSEEIGRL